MGPACHREKADRGGASQGAATRGIMPFMTERKMAGVTELDMRSKRMGSAASVLAGGTPYPLVTQKGDDRG